VRLSVLRGATAQPTCVPICYIAAKLLRVEGCSAWSRLDKFSVLGCGIRENKERWRELCEQAAVEQDPKKLLELTRQINDFLLGKPHRLEGEASPDKPKKLILIE
jgi:hypothetical protein